MHEPDRSRKSGVALEKSYQFLLGDRLQTLALDVQESLIEATYAKSPTTHLQNCNLRLEKLRFLLRLCMDLRYLDLGRYEFSARAIDEIGRLVGGWLKVQRGTTA